MKLTEIKSKIENGDLNKTFSMLTKADDVSKQQERYIKLIDEAIIKIGDQEGILVSAPGRTEVGGNHTDHQLGKVLAASVTMDIAAVVVKANDNVEYNAKDFNVRPIALSDLTPKDDEKFTTESLIKGTLAFFKDRGYNIGGFKCFTDSEVLPGSGISSSAAFEVLMGTILSELYNDGKVNPIEIAQIGQLAENHFFGKPCGLMDQMASSVGGFVSIDFKDNENPIVEKIDYDFDKSGLLLCLVDTKGNHVDLSEEYGRMPSEMKSVAKYLGHEYLSQCSFEQFIKAIPELHKQGNDRMILRAYHYFSEMERVEKEITALKNNDVAAFRKNIIESGQSSYMFLQNVYVANNYQEQDLSVALACSEYLLKEDGAWRVHGGGLAGTIQAFVPVAKKQQYQDLIESIYGKNSCHFLSIRPIGGYRLI